MKFQYPLQWLPQQPRTKRPERARFGNHTISNAGFMLSDELRKLNAKDVIISSNLQQTTRGDRFLSNQRIEDAGIVIYFKLDEKDKAMACDKWDKPEQNLWALYLSVAAIRGLERWGGSEFLDGLFTGFKALPGPEDLAVEYVDYFKGIEDRDYLSLKYKQLLMELHPDKGGDPEKFQEMMKQYKIKKSTLESSQ